MTLTRYNPFRQNPPPICRSPEELDQFVRAYPGYSFCLYLADRSLAQWAGSLSVKYVNRLFQTLIYVPVNVQAGDEETLAATYQVAGATSEVVAMNHAQPHKSNSSLRRLVSPTDRVDFVVRQTDGWRGYDLNGASFRKWLATEIDSLRGMSVVILGVGGAGEAIARVVAREDLAELVLIDRVDRSCLTSSIRSTAPLRFVYSPRDIGAVVGRCLLVNAAGAAGEPTVKDALARWAGAAGVFVDLRANDGLGLLMDARGHGWSAFSGHGMNLYNDHWMLGMLAPLIGEPAPTITELANCIAEVA